MDNIIDFINQFTLDEFACNKGKYTYELDDSEFGKLFEKTKSFFHTVMTLPGIYSRTGYEFEDEESIEIAPMTVAEMRNRILFKIEHYTNPVYGDAIKRVVSDNNLYCCYVSREDDTGIPLGYSRKFFVAESDEGLRIIYLMRFMEGKWDHQHEHEPSQVLNPGELIETKKFNAPVEEVSLTDYGE